MSDCAKANALGIQFKFVFTNKDIQSFYLVRNCFQICLKLILALIFVIKEFQNNNSKKIMAHIRYRLASLNKLLCSTHKNMIFRCYLSEKLIAMTVPRQNQSASQYTNHLIGLSFLFALFIRRYHLNNNNITFKHCFG